jgi:Uncharacterised methyltransferase family (DUF6094)
MKPGESGACLRFPASPFSAINPCIEDGAAFSTITGETCARRYGVELDAYRAEQAASVLDEVIHGDCLQVHCPVESYSLAFLNPPYDWIGGKTRCERTERVFLAHTYRWLKAGGILILVVPAVHVRDCAEILAGQFKAVRIFRRPLQSPCATARWWSSRRGGAAGSATNYGTTILSRDVPSSRISGGATNDLLHWATSAPRCTMFPRAVQPSWNIAAFRSMRSRTCFRDPRPIAKAARILFPQPAAIKGRPLTPLHGGHVALCAVSGMLNGVFGSGKDLHVAAWQAVKVIDRSEKTEEDGTIIQRERERFTNELTLVYASGETAILR